MKILIVDNFDSFTYNLYHLIEALMPENFSLKVKRNNDINIKEVGFFDKVVISPGPGLPENAGITCEIIKKYGNSKNILGVCLGHQAIAEVYGAKLKNLPEVLHGVAVETILNKQADKIFINCPDRIKTGRYHSWVVDKDSLPNCFEITAVDVLGHIMAIKHKESELRGVQFHPESIMTENGRQIIKNWLLTP